MIKFKASDCVAMTCAAANTKMAEAPCWSYGNDRWML